MDLRQALRCPGQVSGGLAALHRGARDAACCVGFTASGRVNIDQQFGEPVAGDGRPRPRGGAAFGGAHDRKVGAGPGAPSHAHIRRQPKGLARGEEEGREEGEEAANESRVGAGGGAGRSECGRLGDGGGADAGGGVISNNKDRCMRARGLHFCERGIICVLCERSVESGVCVDCAACVF